MRVIVCGSRYCDDRRFVQNMLHDLDHTHGFTMLIEGGSRGVDQFAGEWADRRGIPHVLVPAHWEYHGKKAGPVRNATMLSLSPDRVIAFPGGNGTANMIKQAKQQGIPVVDLTDESIPAFERQLPSKG